MQTRINLAGNLKCSTKQLQIDENTRRIVAVEWVVLHYSSACVTSDLLAKKSQTVLHSVGTWIKTQALTLKGSVKFVVLLPYCSLPDVNRLIWT